MPIDPSIILAAKTPQIALQDPLEQYGKSLALKGLMGQQELQGLQLQQAQRGIADDEAVRQAYVASNGDPATLRALLSGKGQYKAVNEFDKAQLERDAKRATIDKDKSTTAKNNLDREIKHLEHGAAIWETAKDQPSYESAIRFGVMQGIFSPKIIEHIPQQFDPAVINQLKASGLSRAQQLADQRAREGQQITMRGQDITARGQDIGARTAAAGQGVTMRGQDIGAASSDADRRLRALDINTNLGPADAVTAPQVGVPQPAPAAIPAAPGNATAATFPRIAPAAQAGADAQAVQMLAQKYLGNQQEMARIDQNIAEAQAAIRSAVPEQRGALQRDLAGMQMAKQMAGGMQGAQPVFTPAQPSNTSPVTAPASATGADGNLSARERAKGPKPLTEFQGKAQMFGTRAAEADKILAPLEDNVYQAPINMKRSVEGKPLGGIGSMVINAALSENQQKVEQAQRNFVNAVLRQESGAVISPTEFANAIKQYFPQPNDGPAVREQKRANRKSVIDGFTLEAGSAAPRVQAAGRLSEGAAMEDSVLARRAIAQGADRAAVAARYKERTGRDLH